jgi:hypothetical protein
MKSLFVLIATLGLLFAGEKNLGQPLALKKTTPIASLMASPDQYVGKTVQVKGKVAEVCDKMGCWMNLKDGESMVRIKVKDGEIVFPKDAIGKLALAEGTMKKIEMTKDQAIAAAKHEAEEQGRKFDPASITGGKTIYQIAGTGARILE